MLDFKTSQISSTNCSSICDCWFYRIILLTLNFLKYFQSIDERKRLIHFGDFVFELDLHKGFKRYEKVSYQKQSRFFSFQLCIWIITSLIRLVKLFIRCRNSLGINFQSFKLRRPSNELFIPTEVVKVF